MLTPEARAAIAREERSAARWGLFGALAVVVGTIVLNLLLVEQYLIEGDKK